VSAALLLVRTDAAAGEACAVADAQALGRAAPDVEIQIQEKNWFLKKIVLK
jgi:hypothetical protein